MPMTAEGAATAPDETCTFADLGVAPAVLETLTAAGFVHPFPIQHMAIPIGLRGDDLIGQARTGTGKTLAFGLPLLQRICLPGDDGFTEPMRATPQALVLCPTRELALQVAGDLEIPGAGRGARILTVYGGVGYETQLDGLGTGVDVVVGTPGRVIDLMDRGSLKLGHIGILVLDEADEMLDLGFLPDVERIIAKTPASRQTMLFSATMPAAIVALARSHLRQPINIRAEAHDSQMTVPETTQFVYQAHDLDKPAIIGKLLQSPEATRVMVFCRTKRAVERVTADLTDRGFTATCIHGDLNQMARERALARFRAGQAQIIVATDVAARGIDVDAVTHVVNYDCPDDEKTYVHRIGRTGRAGHEGVAVTLVDWADLTRWQVINRALGLPFDTLAEAYSTTPQLLADLQVPEGATGRLAPPPDRPRVSDRPRGDRTRGDRGRPERADRGRGDRGARPSRPDRTDRTRRQDQPDRPDVAAAEPAPRRRRRRRNGEDSVKPGQAPAADAATTAPAETAPDRQSPLSGPAATEATTPPVKRTRHRSAAPPAATTPSTDPATATESEAGPRRRRRRSGRRPPPAESAG